MKKIVIIFFIFNVIQISEAKGNKNELVDIKGLEQAIDFCNEVINKREAIYDLLNDSNLTAKQFRVSYDKKTEKFIQTIKEIIPDSSFYIEDIMFYYKVGSGTDITKRSNLFIILIRSPKNNKILLFFFNNSEDGKWKFFKYSKCKNWELEGVDLDQPCIDE